MTRITIEDENGKSIIEDVRNNLNIFSMAELIERTLLAQGYLQENINEILIKGKLI